MDVEYSSPTDSIVMTLNQAEAMLLGEVFFTALHAPLRFVVREFITNLTGAIAEAVEN